MQLISPKTQVVASLGISVLMVQDRPTEVPESLVDLAVARGARHVEGAAAAKAPAVEATVDEAVAAIRALMEAGDTKAFGSTGEPKLLALKAKIGKPVTDAVRDEAWAIVKAEA